MPIVRDNMLTTGISGELGKQLVFRQWGGDTIVSKAPIINQQTVESELRKKQRLRFKEATGYAKKAMSDLLLKQAYQSKCKQRQTAYARAIQDYLLPPSIEEINLSNYTDEPDSFIRVYATDDFQVKQVYVRIVDEKGDAIEAGFAGREGKSDWWKFATTVPNRLSEGGKVIAVAYDLPGNKTTKEIRMNT